MVRVLRVRAYADPDHRAQDAHWAETIAAQVSRANAVLEAEFGVHLDLESVRPWQRPPARPGTLGSALDELIEADRGRDVDWVVGWVGPLADRSEVRDLYGLAPMFGRHFVLRAMESDASRAAVATWDALTPADRAQMARDRRVHKETSMFLHEWGHTLGAVHECEGSSIMSKGYSLLASSFSPASARLVDVGLRHRGASAAEELHAWASEYRAAAATLRGAAWDCPVMEDALARAGEDLATRAARADAWEALDRFVRSRMGEVRACYGKALESDPALGRRTALRFDVQPDGTVAHVELASDTASPEVAACVGVTVAAWKTPLRPPAYVRVEYPLVSRTDP
jgi:hypothetical protein